MCVAKLCQAAVWLTATAVGSMNTTQMPPKTVTRLGQKRAAPMAF
jgi:hypothetical protein